MIATIMLTTALASLTVVLAAYCAECGLRAVGRPARGPWIIASLATVAVPLGQLVALSIARPVITNGGGSAQQLPLTTILTVGMVERFNAATVAHLEYWLVALWVCASLAMSVRLFLAHRALARLARTWRHGEVARAPVWISERYGPAIVGLDDPEIVVPRSLVSLPLAQQHLAVAHELEHIAARDQWLVRAAELAVAAAPWNPFAWLAARRLRSAIEIDCDARVLQRKPNVGAYASLVLNVASWPREAPSGALALGETGVAQLERRLRLMTIDPRSRRLAPAILLLIAALVFAAYACDVAITIERPETREALTSRNEVHTLARVVTTATNADNPFFEFQVDEPVIQAPGSVSPRYPQILRQAGVEGELLVQFVVDAEGRAVAETFKVLESSHDLFAQSVQSALPEMRFIPAEVGGKRVKQLVQMPFVFTIAK